MAREKDQTHLAISHWCSPESFPTQSNIVVAVFAVENAFDAIAELRKRGLRCEDVVSTRTNKHPSLAARV